MRGEEVTTKQLTDYLLGRSINVRFQQLKEVLEAMGWKAEVRELPPKCYLFEHPDTDLFIVLSLMESDQFVSQTNLISVRNTLQWSGLYD